MMVVAEVLGARGLAEVDDRFADAFVTNPRSGELIKGHAIVLAELGLCRYEGRIVRDPAIFEQWPKAVRAQHIIVRLALVRELLHRLGREEVVLYLQPRPTASFLSATFAREVAEEHFAGGARTRSAVMWRQVTEVERLFMTFLETPALNRQFREAEAVLVGGPGAAF
jgi:hypothetical protein